MARLTARLKRLEARDGARGYDDLSDAELDARLCDVGERLTGECREMLRDGMSAADIAAKVGRSPDGPLFAALFAEAQTPAFDAARFLANLKEKRGAAR